MKNMKTFTYKFNNGTIVISPLRFDRKLEINLTDEADGTKRLIGLDQNIFLTVKGAKAYAIELLSKYNLL